MMQGSRSWKIIGRGLWLSDGRNLPMLVLVVTLMMAAIAQARALNLQELVDLAQNQWMPEIGNPTMQEFGRHPSSPTRVQRLPLNVSHLERFVSLNPSQ